MRGYGDCARRLSCSWPAGLAGCGSVSFAILITTFGVPIPMTHSCMRRVQPPPRGLLLAAAERCSSLVTSRELLDDTMRPSPRSQWSCAQTCRLTRRRFRRCCEGRVEVCHVHVWPLPSHAEHCTIEKGGKILVDTRSQIHRASKRQSASQSTLALTTL